MVSNSVPEGARRRSEPRDHDRDRTATRHARHSYADDIVCVPRSPTFLRPVFTVVPLQLLAYGCARLHGLNMDRPRSLAKTVTVQ